MNACVSVIMPSFRQAEFIEQSVRSVLGDAGQPIAELIVMDGGSQDGTVDVLKRLQTEFGEQRLRWQSEPDRGTAHALNKALALARYPIIGWLNSDDLYVPGAAARAVAYLDAHPEHWMVYGQAEHVDAEGRSLEPYPTLPPEAGLAGFAQGCFICQPSVFLRRVALRMLGGFDEKQKTAFDMALWMRLFGPHAQRIGFVDALQAQSRLHDACITLTQRERVIGEGMALLARHLGAAPLHWALTYVDEVVKAHPFGAAADPRRHLDAFAERCKVWLTPADHLALLQRLSTDRRVALALEGVQLAMTPDGWVAERAELQWRPDVAGRLVITARCNEAMAPPDAFFVDALPLPPLSRDAEGRFTVSVPLTATAGDTQEMHATLVTRLHDEPSGAQEPRPKVYGFAFRVEQMRLTQD